MTVSVQQAAPGERYLHEIVQHSLGVLQIVTLVPYTRRLIIDSTLSNERSFMAVVLDAVSGVAFCDPEVIFSLPSWCALEGYLTHCFIKMFIVSFAVLLHVTLVLYWLLNWMT